MNLARPHLPVTLTARLLAILVTLLAVAGLLVAVSTTLAMRTYLTDRLDSQVLDSVGRASRDPDDVGQSDDQPGPRRPPLEFGLGDQEGSLAAVTTGSGWTAVTLEVKPGAHRPSPEPLPTKALRGLDSLDLEESGVQQVELDGAGTYRVAVRRGEVQGQPTILVSGLPTHDLDRTVRRMLLAQLLLTGAAVLAAGVVGQRVVRRTLQPLKAVATTAHEVAGMQLDTGQVGETARVPEEYVDARTEVGQVAGALNLLLGHMEGALDARHRSEQQVRQFVADASHELRTPLATIMGYAELARRNPEYDGAEALLKVEAEGVRMRGLVEDLLLLARLDSGRPLAREEVDLTLLALEGVQDAQVLAPDHEWVLDLPDEPVSTIGDGPRLHQGLTNLLTNARRHTPPGTRVTVSVSREPTGVRLRVADNGPGIPEELRSRVFERFTRADASRTRDSGGAGLGLALVQAIAAAHGGLAYVESRPGSTVFTVDLPGGAVSLGT
ncbi:sensor histidine kinase [Nocardioides marmoribigeumensis]|uniref:histidine kinase n=1 Tax=Nocardioides marmoribigeumensis TaxID=433649 RepID=A0ABU2BWW8_9ACTN|nr:ATP-binding protein [Nocardioides marmoribigeumensis]MDR7362773.1 two-component system OmpR family sensor kinase [Nocardioides marmoribigeumensis]